MSRQGSAAVLPRGDLRPDQANLIRELIREELRRGLGRRSRRSEREGSVRAVAVCGFSRKGRPYLTGGKRSW